MITYFAARLRCLQCGEQSNAELYTKLLDAPGTVTLRIGDDPDVDPNDFTRAFLQLRMRRSNEPFRVLLPWRCGQCGWGNWALVTMAIEGKVQAIEAIPLDRTTLPLAQFIVYNLDEYFERLTDTALYEADADGEWRLRADFPALLAASLPEPPGRAPSFEDFV